MSLYDDAPPRRTLNRIWLGRFADDVTEVHQLCWVIIDDIDSKLSVGPCRWQTRTAPLSEAGSAERAAILAATTVDGLKSAVAAALEVIQLPQRNDECLVIFDNNREPWVAAWWPAAYND